MKSEADITDYTPGKISISVKYPRSKFSIATNTEGLVFHLNIKKPNWFHRIMQRLFFGFKWEDA